MTDIALRVGTCKCGNKDRLMIIIFKNIACDAIIGFDFSQTKQTETLGSCGDFKQCSRIAFIFFHSTDLVSWYSEVSLFVFFHVFIWLFTLYSRRFHLYDSDSSMVERNPTGPEWLFSY